MFQLVLSVSTSSILTNGMMTFAEIFGVKSFNFTRLDCDGSVDFRLVMNSHSALFSGMRQRQASTVVLIDKRLSVTSAEI